MTEEYIKLRKKYNLIYHNTINDGIMYKYCSFETLKLIIENQNLFYSTALDFNDPFELPTEQMEIYDDYTYIEKFVVNGSSEEVKEKILNNFKKDSFQFYKRNINSWNKMKEDFGISCFSKSPLINLMWSHYSDKHKGVCIGFNFNKYEQPLSPIQMPVRYIKSLETYDYLNMLNENIGDIFMYNWLLTKSSVWNYEKEIRQILVYSKGLQPINIKSIEQIYLGLKFDKTQLKELEELLKNNNLEHTKIIDTKIDPSTFSIKTNCT